MQNFELLKNCSLDSWSLIGRGGFGDIFKAKHKGAMIKVAIKLLRFVDGSSLQKEAELMHHGRNPYVVQVFGVYQGVPPGGKAPKVGLVMELVERGSVESLLLKLEGPPPWALAFRLAHQVALGMNFLHQLSHPLLHLDLKPSNVLLDHGFQAKITDFGLARFIRTISSVGGAEGGTLSYMPPEAFKPSYQATPASDSYSYAILLWSLITGKQPYIDVRSCIIRCRIPEGDRPCLKEVNQEAVKGLGELVDLMVRCWDPRPRKRPTFYECLPETEKVFELHEHGINDAIHLVSKALDDDGELSSSCSRMHHLHISSGLPLAQKTPGNSTPPSKAKARHHPMRMLSADPTLQSANHAPVAVSSSSRRRNRSICIENATAVMIGNNNKMTVVIGGQTPHRNPTAPPSVNHMAPQPGKPFQ